MKGFDTTIKISDVVVAAQVNGSLNMSTSTKNISDLITLGWEEHIAYIKGWTMNLSGAYIIDGAAFTELKLAFIKAKPVAIELSSPEGRFGGQAIITNFNINAPFDRGVTYNIQVKGISSLGKI